MHIIIVHQSEIIRKGISNSLRELFADKVSDFNSISNILPSTSSVCLIAELTLLLESINNVNTLLAKGVVLSIVAIDPSGKGHPSVPSDAVITLNESSYEIVALIKSFDRKNDADGDTNNTISSREKDILKHVALGLTNKEIADRLFISTHTVISHRKNITEKLGIKTIPGLTLYAFINGLIDISQVEGSVLQARP